MSKRFGRKQKRAFRSQVKGLEEYIQQKDETISRLQKIVNQAEDWDKEIVNVLGSHSALRLDTSKIKREDLPSYMKTIGAMNLSVLDTSMDMPIQTTFYNLHKIFTDIKHNPEAFRTMIRLIAHNGKQSAMYIDDQYLERCGFTERDIKWLAEDIARRLAYHMNKEYGHNDKDY